MNGHMILNLLTTLFLEGGTDNLWLLAGSAATIFGFWGMFRKSGIPGWMALIPCLRELKLGQATGLEKEGRVAFVARACALFAIIVSTVCEMVLVNFTPENREWLFRLQYFLEIVEVVMDLIVGIHLIRFYLGLIEVYGRRKAWIVLWLFFRWLPAVRLGDGSFSHF